MATPRCALPALPALLALLLLAAVQSAESKGPPRPRLREADIDRILANNRIVNSYVKCLLDKETCSPDGSELKRALPDALATGCARCSANEKLLSEKVILHLMRKRKSDWVKLSTKYDPSGQYAKRYAALAASTTPRPRKASKRP